VHNVRNTPVMTVAIFCGESKPLILEEFLDQFVDEMNHLFMNGLMTVGRLVGSRTDWFGTAEVPGLEVVLAETEAAVVLVMAVVVMVVAGAGQSASSNGSTGPQNQQKVDEQSVRTVGVDTIATVREGFTLRQNFRDQWCMANSGEVVRYETATKTGNEITVQGNGFLSQVPAFTEPCLSTEANVYSASMNDLNTGTLKH
uniref:Uncharacterized protein n=1 Tax=Anopheles merus TaxID=30066 RepID=A0A182VBK1_ANOME